MNCLHPVRIKNVFFDVKKPVSFDNMPYMNAPCGKCYSCRNNKVNELALRTKHEMAYKKKACMLTLTFRNDYLPSEFNKKEGVDFMKRLRSYIKYHNLPYKISFSCVGEYGHERHRPHFHYVIMGMNYKELYPLIWKTWTRVKKTPRLGKKGRPLKGKFDKYRVLIGNFKIRDCYNDMASFYMTKYMLKDEYIDFTMTEECRQFNAMIRGLRKAHDFGFSPLRLQLPPLLRKYFSPFAMDEYRIVIANDYQRAKFLNELRRLKNKVKQQFNHQHCVTFKWTSQGLGKDYAVENASDIMTDFCIKDGEFTFSVPKYYQTVAQRTLNSDVSFSDLKYRDMHTPVKYKLSKVVPSDDLFEDAKTVTYEFSQSKYVTRLLEKFQDVKFQDFLKQRRKYVYYGSSLSLEASLSVNLPYIFRYSYTGDLRFADVGKDGCMSLFGAWSEYVANEAKQVSEMRRSKAEKTRKPSNL